MKDKNIKRIGTYTTAAGIAAFFPEIAAGQIEYHDIDPDSTFSTGESYSIDVNRDGTDDFTFNADSFKNTGGGGSWFTFYRVKAEALNSNSILGPSGGGKFVEALNYDDSVSVNCNIWWKSTLTMAVYSTHFTSSYAPWADVTNKYMGVRIQDGSDTLYGWVRLDIPAGVKSFTVKDFAFNTIPQKSIKAGQTLVSDIPGDDKNPLNVYTFGNKLIISTPVQYDYYIEIIDMSGRIIKKTNTGSSHTIFSINDLSTGFYIVNIQNDMVNFRKKIFINKN